MPNSFSTGRWFTPSTWVYLLAHVVLIVLGYALVMAGNLTVEAIGASLIAAGVSGIVVFVYIRFSQDAADRLKVMNDFGIVTAFEVRASSIKPEYDRRIRNAREIDVMGCGLNALREDYRSEFAEWAQRCKVRVLLIDPTYPQCPNSYAQQREEEEGDRPGSIAASVELFLKDTAAPCALPGHRFQVRLYTCLPALNIFRVDDEIFWGPYLIGGPSRNNPTMIVKRGGVLFDKLIRHFEMVWSERSRSA